MSHDRQHINELQLFHGTSSPMAVQAILIQNFDCRLAGKNAAVFGKGSYFAVDASYSDRYAEPEDSNYSRWMFLARVLAGKSAVGKREYTRPPPLDPHLAHGPLYDSCVDNKEKPKIYAIFDDDQCYPEYVIGYVKK